MFGMFGGTEARRLPGRFLVPWEKIMLAVIILITLAGIVYGMTRVLSQDTSTLAVSQPVAQPFVDTQDLRPVQPAVLPVVSQPQPIAQPVQLAPEAAAPVANLPATAAVENPPAQQNTQPEVVAPTTPKVGDYQVVWTKVQDGFDPSNIPVEAGFYSGQYLWNLYRNTNEGDHGPFPPELEQKLHSNRFLDTSTNPHPDIRGTEVFAPVRSRYAWRILPHLEGKLVAVSIARDETNKNIVLASLDADRYGPYLLLSIDGERSWCRLNLIPITWKGQATNGVTPEQVRVAARDGEIHLYGQYSLGAGPSHLYWWRTTVDTSTLPCS